MFSLLYTGWCGLTTSVGNLMGAYDYNELEQKQTATNSSANFTHTIAIPNSDCISSISNNSKKSGKDEISDEDDDEQPDNYSLHIECNLPSCQTYSVNQCDVTSPYVNTSQEFEAWRWFTPMKNQPGWIEHIKIIQYW